jgi:2-C-methyl-D-erythritol 4-phosphate cytidylyltransferase/2-C-methyl-D-erythritol 2,4-cyclodiphosphate synthase
MTATYALIPAAGRAARFSSAENKIFALLGGKPILARTAEAFASHPAIDGIVVVAGPSEVSRCREALTGLDKVLAIVAGGQTRQDSVAIGLFTLGGDPDDLILVHDAARPLVPAAVIDRCIMGAKEFGNAAAALPVTDTLKSADENLTIQRTIDRDGLWAMQTPQAFRLASLFEAHSAARSLGWVGTDEAALVEQFGEEPVHIVLGDPSNLKVTRPEDLPLAEAIWQSRHPAPLMKTRIGFGYDIHPLMEGRRLMLGGIEIPSPRGLDGHSDADVLLHALCDALLGAAGLPDIGHLFPNTDDAYKGISSLKLLGEVVRHLEEANYSVGNADMTLIAEAPKIAPYIDQMRTVIADSLRVEPSQVGIKATTNEGLGSLGRGEGIAAHAVALIISKA